jgi:hypothetical protein
MTIAVNILLYAAIVLVPLAIAVLFIRLGRRFGLDSRPLPPRDDPDHRE